MSAPSATLSHEVAAEVLEERFRGYPFFEFAHEWGEQQMVPIVSNREMIFVLGGNSAGKTALGSWMTAARFIGYCPVTGRDFRNEPNRDYRIKPFNIYVVGTTGDDIVQRLQPALRQWIPESDYSVDGKTGDWVSADNMTRIMFKSVDQKARAFQGDEVDWVWADEHPEKRDVWSEILARIGRRLGQVLVTMTAWQGVHWLWNFMFHPDEYPQEHKCIARIPLDANPYWTMCNCGFTKRWHPNEGACVHPDSSCQKYDPSIGQEKLSRYRKKWRGLEYKIRFEGHYLLKAGQMVVDPDTLEAHMKKAQDNAIIYGYFNEKTQLVSVGDAEHDEALFRILRAPNAEHSYVMGVDVGGGNVTGDYHAAVVLDLHTGEQVATMHTRRFTPRDISWPLVQLARFYQDAHMVVEVNNHGGVVMDRITMDLGYGNVYRRRAYDAAQGAPTRKLGFLTDKRSKHLAVDIMVGLMQRTLTIMDPMILHELYGFLYLKENREGKFNIGNGNPDGYDDLCMALVMASVGFRAQGVTVDGGVAAELPPPPPRKKSIAESIEEAHRTGQVLGPSMSDGVPQQAEEITLHDVDAEMLQLEMEQMQMGDFYDD